jgi:hypothetical protein
MFKNKFPIRLILNSKASNVLDFHTRHYSGRGLMKKMTGNELAKEIGISPEKLQETFSEYNDIAAGKKKDPYGKRFFHNVPINVDDDFHVSLMQPVLHFTMGGVEINDKAEVLNSEGKPFEGLYACGEVAGGVHGANRLGGSSLLGCVVYGRVAGETASEYMFQKVLKGGASTAAQRLGMISLHIDPSQPGRVIVDWSSGSLPSYGIPDRSSAAVAPTPTPTASASEPKKVTKSPDPKDFVIPEREIPMEEVAKHNTKESIWIVVKGIVLDVTNWLDDHPGGPGALLNFMGRDATEGEFLSLGRAKSFGLICNVIRIRDVA